MTSITRYVPANVLCSQPWLNFTFDANASWRIRRFHMEPEKQLSMKIKFIFYLCISLFLFINLRSAENEQLSPESNPDDKATTLEEGKSFVTSILVPRDEKRALELFLTAGLQGDPLGYFNAARLLDYGAVCIELNAGEATVLYAKAEEALSSLEVSRLNGEQLYSLGTIYKSGLGGVPVSREKARDFLERSSELNYPPAMRELGMHLLTFQEGKSKEAGVNLICESAGAGDLMSVLTLPVLSQRTDIDGQQRRVIEIARNTVFKKLEEAVESDDVTATFRLGTVFVIEEKRVIEGIALLEKAASMGSVESLFSLGFVYAKGKAGVKKDLKLARAYWEKAAALGDCRANILLDSIDE